VTTIPIRTALESYRINPSLAPFLSDAFLDKMELFAQMLALWGARVNLTAKPSDPAETAFHIVDSLMPIALLPDLFNSDRRVLDFGSGAGFPGLILASTCAASFTLVEARQKRASFLKVAAAELGLENVKIPAARVEPAALSPSFQTVLARASGSPADFYAIAGAALLPGGVAIVYASPSQRLDLAAAQQHALVGYRRHSYNLRRGHGIVERVLAVWRKTEKLP
jgi:16S rRNA (guanine527-N7)-methyltransferase